MVRVLQKGDVDERAFLFLFSLAHHKGVKRLAPGSAKLCLLRADG